MRRGSLDIAVFRNPVEVSEEPDGFGEEKDNDWWGERMNELGHLDLLLLGLTDRII
jgi:hypothetical protein